MLSGFSGMTRPSEAGRYVASGKAPNCGRGSSLAIPGFQDFFKGPDVSWYPCTRHAGDYDGLLSGGLGIR